MTVPRDVSAKIKQSLKSFNVTFVLWDLCASTLEIWDDIWDQEVSWQVLTTCLSKLLKWSQNVRRILRGYLWRGDKLLLQPSWVNLSVPASYKPFVLLAIAMLHHFDMMYVWSFWSGYILRNLVFSFWIP